jgi:hypothetical protein
VYQADLSSIIPGKIKKMNDAFGGRPTGPYVFINHNFGTLARWPNNEYSEFTKCVDKGRIEKHRPDGGKICNPGAFIYSEARAKRWNFANGVWMRGFWTHDWDSHAVRAASYGAENGTNDVIRLAARIPYGVMGGTWGARVVAFTSSTSLMKLICQENGISIARKRFCMFIRLRA